MQNIKEITTNLENQEYWSVREYEANPVKDCMHVVNIFSEVHYQIFRGFGGAFTEAAAHNYAMLSQEQRKKVIQAYFSNKGLAYNFGRLHMNSCDFALGNYTYVKEGDDTLSSFDIKHDFHEIIPMIKDAQKESENEMEFLVSPWSPPAFFKTNSEMNHGGKLRKEYFQAWADYFVKFIRAYEKVGIKIGYLTVQNEPEAVQTWDSCIYTAKEEGAFVRDFLFPTLQREGLKDVKIFVWDHNKEEAYTRIRETVKDEKVKTCIAGAAIHWYTGDHFESIELIKKQYPKMEVFFTEGCVEYSRFADSGEVQKAEMYAHDILGNLNAGISASLDWNLLLDEKGGPNHVGNFCAAPIMCNPSQNTYEKRLMYYYIGHFSRYIKPQSVRIGTTKYSDKVEVTGFCNPDGERVIIVLNKSAQEMPITLREDGLGVETIIQPHTIKTFCCK